MSTKDEKQLPVIFGYFDLTKYLRDYYLVRKELDTWFSYRFIFNKTGIDPGYLFKIFQGKKPFPQKSITTFAKLFSLSKRETEYFRLLVLFNRARSNDQIKLYFEKMIQYSEVAARKVSIREYEYYRKWYHIALRQILSYYPFKGDYAELAKLTIPEITVAEAKSGIEILCNLGLVTVMDDGTYMVPDKMLSTGDDWHSIAIRQFQKDTILLAHNAIDTVEKEKRDISTMTVTLSEEVLDEAREIIRQFRKSMRDLSNKNENPNGAYHVNIQLIPIGKHFGGNAK